MLKHQINAWKTLDGWDDLCPLQSLIVKQKKQKLLEMAKNGDARPTRKHLLGRALDNYIYPSSRSYDQTFDKQIRTLRPDWFITQFMKSNEKRQKLLEMAKNGEPRPIMGRHPMAACFNEYIQTNLLFKQEIENLRPDWFTDTVAENKKAIIEMAKNGEPRPIIGHHPMANFLVRYTDPTQPYYYEDFDKEIRSLRPDWFISTRQQLLQMAKNGEPRPNRRHKLGGMLTKFTIKSSKCYNASFDKEIRFLRPDWFINKTVENKKQLLQMAKNGEKKPAQKKHPLGHKFVSYTLLKSSSYDAVFCDQIREVRPDWLVTQYHKFAFKKEELLKLAYNGESRPSKKTSLGVALISALRCSEFCTKIKTLRPDWFKNA